jgi:hypothetical protein
MRVEFPSCITEAIAGANADRICEGRLRKKVKSLRSILAEGGQNGT